MNLIVPCVTPDTASLLPLVSVIIPAFNAAAYVLETLQTVADQAYGPLEIILVDDGSTDATVALVHKHYPQVQIISQPNAGVAAARNIGLRAATGEFICLLDADDGWYPGKLHAQVNYLQQHPETGAVYHAWQVWPPDDAGNFQPMAIPEVQDASAIDAEKSGWIYPQLLMECIVHTSTLMLRREWLEKVGFFNAELKIGEDYDYWLRLSRLTRIDKLAGLYSFYRGSPGSLTRQMKTVNYEYEVVKAAVRQWGLSAPDGRELSKAGFEQRLSQLAFDFAYGHFHQGSVRLARQAAWQAFKHDSRRYRALLYWLASFFKRVG